MGVIRSVQSDASTLNFRLPVSDVIFTIDLIDHQTMRYTCFTQRLFVDGQVPTGLRVGRQCRDLSHH